MSDSPITFRSLGLPAALEKAVAELGYEHPSAVQAACIPLLLAGHDVLGQAQTGTGKTGAFALPFLARLQVEKALPQVLVLTPTRELAVQVAEAFQAYARHMPGFHVLPLYGGQSYGLQLRQLQRGPHVIVATPGRLLDHIRRKTIDLSALSAMVLDEADEMLRMGFIEDVEAILAETPPERITALFSATMPEPIRRITRRYMRDTKEVRIDAQSATVDNIEQVFWPVAQKDKLEALTHLLEIEEYQGVLVFARTRTATADVAEKLEARGFSAAALNGDMNQMMRERTVGRLKDGTLDVVVATDVAARGLDVDRLDLVVNYDIPADPESYVHRIGRTGRAGRTGKAILFVTPRERHLLKSIERVTKRPIVQMPLPSRTEVTEKRIERFRDGLGVVLNEQALEFYRKIYEQMTETLAADPADVAAALLFMAQQEKPFKISREAPKFDTSGASADRGDRDRGQGDRAGRPDRGDRGDRPDRGERPDRGGARSTPMDTYRVDVGRRDGVQVRNIVGALANEGGIDNTFIGAIRMQDDHSTVDLAQGMPNDVLKRLQKILVCQKPMNITRIDRPTHGATPKKAFTRTEKTGPKTDKKNFKKKYHKD